MKERIKKIKVMMKEVVTTVTRVHELFKAQNVGAGVQDSTRAAIKEQ